jgi:hypothetical protein
VTQAAVVRHWSPLALSWLIMTAELVIVVAVIARLPQPEIQLAAWGVVFAIATVIQAPATALLPASTALARDWPAYRRLRRYALTTLAGLTALHALTVLTPLYDVLLLGVMGLPEPVVVAARWALVAMLPWSFGTGYRRFLHGAIIRAGYSRVVIWGTVMRLAISVTLLAVGATSGSVPGATLAAGAVIVGVLAELGYVRWRAKALLPRHLGPRPAAAAPLSVRRFAAFYAPLVVMTLLTMLVQGLVTAVLGRMPRPLESLAVWPVVFGFLVLWQSPALAYTEVVISLLRRPGALATLRRFTWVLAGLVSLGLVATLATPLARLWFAAVMGLPDGLTDVALLATLLALLTPGVRVLHSWYQGIIVAGERTGAILESVVVFLAVVVLVLAAGVAWGQVAGAYVGAVATVVGLLAQTGWLAWRAVPMLRALADPRASPTAATAPPPAPDAAIAPRPAPAPRREA